MRLMISTVNLFVVPEEKDNGQKRFHNKKRNFQNNSIAFSTQSTAPDLITRLVQTLQVAGNNTCSKTAHRWQKTPLL